MGPVRCEFGTPSPPAPDLVRPDPGTTDDQRAGFAVTSRLLSSIVTESLLPAVYIEASSARISGLCVILSPEIVDVQSETGRTLHPQDILAIVPLYHIPILKDSAIGLARRVWLLDPLDMLPSVYYPNGPEVTGSADVSLACTHLRVYLLTFF